MGLVMTVNMIAVGVNTLLLGVLLVLYLKIWREVPTRFTLGLSLFAGVLLIQSVTQLYFFATMMRYYAGGVEGLVLAQNLLATFALLVLVAVTWAPEAAQRGRGRPKDLGRSGG